MRFLIASRSRCGSHMLRTALDSHPDACCHSELYHPKFIGEATAESYLQRLFQQQSPHVGLLVLPWTTTRTALGPTDPGFAAARRRLLEIVRPDRVVILRRRNLLARYLSHEIALQQRRYHILDGGAPPIAQPPLKIDPQDLIDS